MSINRCFLICLCGILFWGCAKKVAPEGGPKDITPAVVLGTEPTTGSTNVSATKMRFVFDDYVDRSVRDAFTVMPTVRFSASYAGDVVDVEFKEPLLPNTTYVVTLGTGFADIRGNKPLQAVSVVFSTGPDIDTGKISGDVLDNTPGTIWIFAYPSAQSLDSTFSPTTARPPYRLPVGSTGRFTLNGLANGTYRIMAVRDANKNAVVDANEDFAMASQDVEVRNGVARHVTLRVGSAIDITPPEAISARSLSNTSVLITFAERVSIVPSSGAPFTIADSNGARVAITSWYQNGTLDDRVYVRLRDTLAQGAYNISIAPGAVADSAGLLMADSARSLSFRGSALRDTTSLRILSVSVRDSTAVDPDSVITITFSDAIDTSGSIRQPVSTWDGPTRLRVGLPSLSRTTWQRVSIPLNGVRNTSGAVMRDTTIVRTLKASDRAEPGSLEGVVIDSADFGRPLLLRVLNARGSLVKSVFVTSGVPFKIDSVSTGEVFFDVIRDSNMNGRYDHGTARPYRPAEAFYTFTQQVVVRPRWTIQDVRLVILK